MPDDEHRLSPPSRHARFLRLVPMILLGMVIVTLALLTGLAPRAQAAASEANEACLLCHSSERIEIGFADGEVLSGFVDGTVFDESRHGGFDCVACHTDKAGYPHDDLEVQSSSEYAAAASVACESCHQSAAEESGTGIHLTVRNALGDSAAPVCADCHGAHDVMGAPQTHAEITAMCETCHLGESNSLDRSVHRGSAIDGEPPTTGLDAPSCVDCHGAHSVAAITAIEIPMCAGCHTDAVHEYDQSVHGAGLAEGQADVATCGDCHGSLHDMKPAIDPESPVYPLNLPQTCAECHGDAELAARHGIEIENAYQLFMDSIHGHALWESGLLVAAGCSQCHGTHDIRKKEDPGSSVHRESIPETCGVCHAGILAAYELSIHGSELADGHPGVPVCTDCHSAHEITAVETTSSRLAIVGECGSCHEESLETFSDTFHGRVTDLGFAVAAQCSDCHGSHDILPASHPDSRIGDTHLTATCQECHINANDNFAEYNPHADADDREAFPLLFWIKKFMETLIIAVLVFFGIHTLLWTGRSLVEARKGRQPGSDPTSKEVR
jgi:hypothetical protein